MWKEFRLFTLILSCVLQQPAEQPAKQPAEQPWRRERSFPVSIKARGEVSASRSSPVTPTPALPLPPRLVLFTFFCFELTEGSTQPRNPTCLCHVHDSGTFTRLTSCSNRLFSPLVNWFSLLICVITNKLLTMVHWIPSSANPQECVTGSSVQVAVFRLPC